MPKVSRIPMPDETGKFRTLENKGNQENETCVIVNTAGTILYVNPDFERTAGYSRYEVLGKNVGHLTNGGPDSAFYGEIWNHVSVPKGDSRSGAPYPTVPTSPANGSVTIAPFCDASGVLSHYVAIRGNGPSLLQREGKSAKPVLWEIVGQLTGTAAHHFNNLLTGILGYCDLLETRLEDRGPEQQYLKEIRDAGIRAASLTRQLLAFGRKEMLQPIEFSLNTLVSDMIRKLRTSMGEDILLVPALTAYPGAIYADPGKIEQVILNLAANAREAIPAGGRITFETATLLLNETIVRQNTSIRRGTYVTLSVHDTGCGMDEETRSHVFEPFFTTKENALGLGMSEVFGIIKQSGGYVWVHNAQHRGTTVTVYFPVRKGVASAVSCK